jgi:N-acetylglucosamine repressor
MIFNDRLYGGTTGFAGEFSHIQMVDDGELCICGKRGCLETAASSNAILKLAKEGIKDGIVSQHTRQFGKDTESITLENVISAAKLGDEFSISILNEIGMIFGKGLSYLIQLLNPGIIVLAGQVARANQFVLIPIQQALNKYCLEQILKNTALVISEIDEQAGMMGTAAMLYQYILSDMSV